MPKSRRVRSIFKYRPSFFELILTISALYSQLKDTVAEKCFLPPLKNREIDTKVNQETLFFYEHSTTIFFLISLCLIARKRDSSLDTFDCLIIFLLICKMIDSDRCISI